MASVGVTAYQASGRRFLALLVLRVTPRSSEDLAGDHLRDTWLDNVTFIEPTTRVKKLIYQSNMSGNEKESHNPEVLGLRIEIIFSREWLAPYSAMPPNSLSYIRTNQSSV